MKLAVTMDEAPWANEAQEQPPALQELLQCLEAARKCSTLYGFEHPTAHASLEAFAAALAEFQTDFHRPTCIFTDQAVLVNDGAYRPTSDSIQISRRLRLRGVMAISFVGEATAEEIASFLSFLNTEPREIRQESGASAYLRRRGVARIVATDAVYVGEDDSECREGDVVRAASGAEDVDRAIAAAIEWLAKQDQPDDASPRMPITEILSRPEMAARLIREAVTKLHASRRDHTEGELVTEVIHDLKGLAATESENWDAAAPQIRRAISKLPKDMLPAASGFTGVEHGMPTDPIADIPDIPEVEDMVARAGSNAEEQAGSPDLSFVESLFGSRAEGLLSSWRGELRPGSVLLSSGRTLETLMVWETSAAEHTRIACGFASLIPRALELGDLDCALSFTESLLKEAGRLDDLSWRSTSATTALSGIETKVLVALVEKALDAGCYRARHVAASLVETLPRLAVELVGLLGRYPTESFTESLRRGIVRAGAAALAPLTQAMRGDSRAARDAALEILAEIGTAQAAREMIEAVDKRDDALVAKAISLMPRIRHPVALEVCIGALTDRRQEARLAAVGSLAQIGGDTAVEQLIRIAVRRSWWRDNSLDRIAAVEALGRIGGSTAIDCLAQIASSRPLIRPAGHDRVKAAAQSVLEQLRGRRPEPRAA